MNTIEFLKRFSTRISFFFLTVTMILALTQCAPARTPGRGAVRGAAAGAVIGNQFREDGHGHKGKGAAIGAAAGMAVGGSRQYRDRRAYYPPPPGYYPY